MILLLAFFIGLFYLARRGDDVSSPSLKRFEKGVKMKLVTAEQMRNIDHQAIDGLGIPGVVMMENAGRKTVEGLIRCYGNPDGQKISIFAGPGNNGGDGLVMARHLHQHGCRVRVFLLVEPEKIKGDAAVNLAIVRKLPIPLEIISTVPQTDGIDLADDFVAIDALFGTGLKREVTGHFAAVVKCLNQADCPVVSVDIPSGLDSDSGQVLGCCVRADLTMTYGLAKLGQFIHPGAELCGRLEVADIGIPPRVVNEAALTTKLLDQEDMTGLLPRRSPASHKGSNGHVLIVAGAAGKTGAAVLCARGCLRSGAGLVSICVPQSLNAIFETTLPEAMTIPLDDQKKQIATIDNLEKILAAAQGKKAVVLGPGLGTDPGTVELVQQLYNTIMLPMVVDADGLNCLVGTPIPPHPADRILTPHPGEMARLLSQTTREIQTDRIGLTRDFASDHQVTMVLKGAATVIADPDGGVAVNSTGNAGMGAGGTGDVLSGVIGGLLAQGLSSRQAACFGVHVHGLAGDRLAARFGIELGYLAGELADEIPAAIRELASY